MKNKIIIPIVILVVLVVILLILPFIKIDKNNKIKYISLSDDISEYDEITCYDDGISYYEKKDISITSIDVEKNFIFYIITLEYKKGNLCDFEFVLEESYITKFINEAQILNNEENIDISSLIEGKTAVIKNKRYIPEDYEATSYINYKLDGKEEDMFIFYENDLLVIQIGYPDEGAKYIAYK